LQTDPTPLQTHTGPLQTHPTPLQTRTGALQTHPTPLQTFGVPEDPLPETPSPVRAPRPTGRKA
jgi:hypothetical protein